MATPNETPPRRIIEWKVPLWGLLTSAVLLISFQARTTFVTEQTSKDIAVLQSNLAVLQAAVATSNTQVIQLGGKIDLHTYRMDAIEADIRFLKQVVGDKMAGARK